MRRRDFLASAIGAIVDAEMVPIGDERLVESDMSMKPHAAVTGIDTASSFDPLADFIDTEWMREKDAVGGNAQFVIVQLGGMIAPCDPA